MSQCEECGDAFDTELGRKVHEAQEHGKNTKQCVRCGDTFHIPPSREDRYKQCSDCIDEYGPWRPDDIGDLISNGKELDVSGENNPFYNERHDESTRTKISQSRQGKLTGSNHPNWKGGISFTRSENWQEIRDAIRDRDNYTCQVCRITEIALGHELDVHHIIPVSEGGDESAGNLISVCRQCHMWLEYS